MCCKMCCRKQVCDGSWAEQEFSGNRGVSDDCIQLITCGICFVPTPLSRSASGR